jgi:ABC-type uncharacterized transport system substrate-binding protein
MNTNPNLNPNLNQDLKGPPLSDSALKARVRHVQGNISLVRTSFNAHYNVSPLALITPSDYVTERVLIVVGALIISQQLKEEITNEPIVCYTALHSDSIPTNMVDSTKSNWLVYRAIVEGRFL